MRWILVLIILYFIPITILFKNNKNFKRSCIYGSIYIVLVTSIAISNIYMSGLNKIEEVLYYQNYSLDKTYKDKYVSNFENKENNIVIKDMFKDDKQNNIDYETSESKNNVNQYSIDKENKQVTNEITKSKRQIDLEIIDQFKKDIYDIERVALVPMRECIPYTKDIAKSLTNISKIREEIVYAEEMCKDVIDIYESMEMPQMSKQEYIIVLSNARNDVKKAYELRQKAMQSAIKLIDTKNPKYIGRITECLKLSDNHISSFKERMNDLKEKVNYN